MTHRHLGDRVRRALHRIATVAALGHAETAADAARGQGAALDFPELVQLAAELAARLATTTRPAETR